VDGRRLCAAPPSSARINAGMAGFQVADASSRRLDVAATISLCAAVAGLAYWYERSYRRWAAQQHPFAAPRARLMRTRTTYQERRAFVTDLARVMTGSTGAGRPSAHADS
jgi:uncharacterized membrane protein YebE (DUF533 family)